MIKVGTDFSGIGSPESALKRLGIPHDLIFGCDIDKYARLSYRALHPYADIIYDDITTRDFDEVPQLDLYVAGFPCQAFSIAGKGEGFNDVRGTLFFNVADFIEHNQPECFILENVKGLLSHDKGRTFQTIIDLLSNGGGTVNGQLSFNTYDDGLGYHIYHKVLNTKDYGIPQNRERVFIVGFKNYRVFRFPKPFPLKLRLKDILQDNPRSKYLISKIGFEHLLKRERFNKYSVLKEDSDLTKTITARCNKLSNDNNFVEVDDKYYLSEKIIKGFQNHKDRHTEKGTGFIWKPKNENDIANCIRANASLCPTDNSIIVHNLQKRSADRPSLKNNKNAGGSGHLSKNDGTSYCLDAGNTQAIELNQIGNIYQNEHNSLAGRIYDEKGLSATLKSEGGGLGAKTGLYKTQNKIRRLTPLECWRLQGFTDEEFYRAEAEVSDTQLYKQAGNSITVNVIAEILKKIYLDYKL